MHGLLCESFIQICCRFGIQLRFSGWPLFGNITGCSHFNFLRCLYLSSGFSHLCSFTEQRLLNYYLREGRVVLLIIILAVESFLKTLFKNQLGNGDGEGKLSINWSVECMEVYYISSFL